MDKEHAKYMHLFALIRYDIPIDQDNFRNAVSVLKVFTNRDLAESEAKRLSKINDESKCIYDVQVTRFVNNQE